ncbi:MAG TPA: DUF58 domain-containing protein [Actinomycetota bacterium]
MSSRWRLTSSGTALGVGVGSLLALGVIARYDELIVFAAAGALLLGLAFLVPRVTSPITIERTEVPRMVERGTIVQIGLRASADGVVPPVRIIDQLAGVSVPIDLPQIDVAKPVHVRYRIQAVRRGVHTVGPMLEERSDPFTLAVRTTEHDVRDDIIVHPVVHNLKFPAGGARQRERNTMVSRISQDPLADFRALRDYVPGDDPRNVHWASTARTGRLVVKDHLEMRKSMRLVVLETLDRTITGPLFEEAVEIAVSIVIDAVTEGISVTARTRDAAHAGRLETITGRREALELFARVQRTESLSTLGADRVRPRGQDNDQVFLIAGGSSPLIDGFATNVWVRHRLVVIRVSERPAELRKLPVRKIDVRNAEEFVGRWRMGMVT